MSPPHSQRKHISTDHCRFKGSGWLSSKSTTSCSAIHWVKNVFIGESLPPRQRRTSPPWSEEQLWVLSSWCSQGRHHLVVSLWPPCHPSPTERRRRTLLSGQQMEHVSQSPTHLLGAGSRRHRDALWWAEWVRNLLFPCLRFSHRAWTLSERLRRFLSFISGHLPSGSPSPGGSMVWDWSVKRLSKVFQIINVVYLNSKTRLLGDT